MHRPIFRCLTIAMLALPLNACWKPAAPLPSTLPEVTQAVLAQPAWLAETQRCPAEFLARKEESLRTNREYACPSGNPGECFARCVSGAAESCYWLGQTLQEKKATTEAVDALFVRSCKLGIASGCTNFTAGLPDGKKDKPEVRACTLQTYERTCGHNDPWGCTMYAFELTRHNHSAADRTKALAALAKSCLNGQDDPACNYGHALRQRLQMPLEK